MMSSEASGITEFTAARMRTRYLVALSLIALLTLLSQWIVQHTLADQEYDSRVVNIAGRQRMLSQRITKAALYLSTSQSEADRLAAQRQIESALALWRQSHTGLRLGDASLGLPGGNSEAIETLFRKLEPDYQAMLAAAQDIAGAANQPQIVAQGIAVLRQHEPAFLEGMNEIVFRYDSEAQRKVDHARLLELGLAALTLTTLVMEALLIFAPAVRRMRHDLHRHQLHEADLERLFSSNPTAMFLVAADTLQIVRGNQRADALMGGPAANYVDHPLCELLDAKFEANRSFIDKVRAGDALNEYEVILLDAQNSVIEALASACHITFEGRRSLVVGITNITEVKKAQQTLQYYATFDEMTGLVNRRTGLLMLATAMNRARRDGLTLSVCYVDMDGLKAVNDQHGHHEGDWLIRSLAAALLASIRDGDVAVRLGGDEFLLILHDCLAEHAQPLLDRIRQQLAVAAHEKAGIYPVSASFGLATYAADRHANAEELVQEADLRMYEAKQNRRPDGQRPD